MATDHTLLRRVAEYQFGPRAGAALFPAGADLTVTHTSSGRPRQIKLDGSRLATYRTDGRLTLGVAGGYRLVDGLPTPDYRVTVGSESEPYVREGRNAFAKFVRAADEHIRPGDEVLVVDSAERLLGVGQADLSGAGMDQFQTGVAVSIREGTND